MRKAPTLQGALLKLPQILTEIAVSRNVTALILNHGWPWFSRFVGGAGLQIADSSYESMITQYELLYIIPATFTDEDVGRIEGTVKALLEKQGATVDSTTRLGKFRFAYPVKKVRHGNYELVRFSAEGAAMKAVDDSLRISTDVLRHLILRADEAGGEKFDLVQFTEINLDNKEGTDDRSRRRPAERP